MTLFSSFYINYDIKYVIFLIILIFWTFMSVYFTTKRASHHDKLYNYLRYFLYFFIIGTWVYVLKKIKFLKL
jgi:hypothetical protein